ncbi:MAG: hypothetical protein Q8S21_03275 [Candidatus Paracaedibacteraceae bacterium]|nr:hypothetical protein [Candidatus Paracaedibacteraceae bacterium]
MKNTLIYTAICLSHYSTISCSSEIHLDNFQESKATNSCTRPIIDPNDLKRVSSKIKYESGIRKRKAFDKNISDALLPKHLKTGYEYLKLTDRDQLKKFTNMLRPKLSPTLRDVVSDEHILSAGFLSKKLNPIDMAGCYIRLGINLKQSNFQRNGGHLASVAFLNSASLYRGTLSLFPDIEDRLDLYLSTAQCFYWAFYNEPNVLKKEKCKELAATYINGAKNSVNQLTCAKRLFWFDNIQVMDEKIKKVKVP